MTMKNAGDGRFGRDRSREPDDRLMDAEQVEDTVARYLAEDSMLASGIAPERDLWPGIEARIGARVIPVDLVARRRVRRMWAQLAAAAAVLVMSTAGATYVITRHLSAPAATVAQRGQFPLVPAADTQLSRQPVTTVANSGTASDPTSATDSASRAASTDAAREHGTLASAPPHDAPASPHSGAQLATYHASGVEHDEARATYDEEIARLRETLDARRSQLDPATVATVEQNLTVIDDAIRQATQALTKDPRSRLLNDELDRALSKKTQLLRAAALLPSA